MWIFTDRLSIALDSFWVGLAGFVLLPWTTLFWSIAYAPIQGVEGFGLLLVAFGFIMDVMSWLGAGREQTTRGSYA